MNQHKNPIMQRWLSLLLALAMILALPAAALEPAANVDDPTEEVTEPVAEDPSEEQSEAPSEEETEAPGEEETEAPTEAQTEAPSEEDTEAPSEAQTEAPSEEDTEAPNEEPTEAPSEDPSEAPSQEDTQVPAQPETQEPGETVTQTPADAVAEEPTETVYVDEQGRYLAPETLVVYRTLTMDAVLEEGEQVPAPTAEGRIADYTGVVAFYDYTAEAKIEGEEDRFHQPFFFYYADGQLQSEEPVFVSAQGWLDLRTPAVAEVTVIAETPEEQAQQPVYVGREVYVDTLAQEHPDFLFAFNQPETVNGLFTGQYEQGDYVDGLVQPVAETAAPQRALTDEQKVEAARSGNAVEVQWGSYPAAVRYRLMRSVNGGQAKVVDGLSKTTDQSYTDTNVSLGNAYVYSVAAYIGDETDLDEGDGEADKWVSYDSTASVTLMADPVVTTKPGSDKITVSWKSVKGAVSYSVCRSVEGGSFVRFPDEVTGTSYQDTQAVEGKHYYYTVQAKAADGTMTALVNTRTDADNKVCIHKPLTLTPTVGKGSVSLKWTGDKGATGFRVLRKESGASSWTKLKDLKGNTTKTYTDTKAVNGKKYVYAVRAYYGATGSMASADESNSRLWGAVAQKSVSVLYFTTVYSDENGLVMKWNAVSGVSGYQVNYHVGANGSWGKPIDVGSKTSYTLKDVKDGTGYYLAIRTYTKDKSGKVTYSAWMKYTKADVYHKPLTVKLEMVPKGVKITYAQDSKATGYRIFRKGGGKTTGIVSLNPKSGSTASYIDPAAGLSSGTNYQYTVRAYYGKSAIKSITTNPQDDWGAYRWSSIQFVATPKVTKAETYYNGVKVSYNTVNGAAGYKIYRKIGSGSWKCVGTVSKGSVSSYVDTSAEKLTSGTLLTYTVRAYNSKKTEGGYDSTGVKLYYMAKPKDVKVQPPTSNGTVITWSAEDNAIGYYIYRKDSSNGQWKNLGLVTGTSYLDTKLTTKSGYHAYTLRSVGSYGGKKWTSTFDKTGYSYGTLWGGKERNAWVKKNGKTYYVDADGILANGWTYLQRNGKTYKYYFDEDTNALVTNMYYHFGVKMREMKTFVEVQLSSNDTYASHVNILLYDSETEKYCIPAVTFRCIGNLSTTRAWRGHGTAYMKPKAGKERFGALIEGGAFERYATRVNGTDSFFHSTLYSRPSTNGLMPKTYNSMINNRNNSVACIRCQDIYAYLIQDIMKNGYGKDHRVYVNIYHNQKDSGPYGIPWVQKISTSQHYDPTDPAYTGKFWYDTQIKEGSGYIKAKKGADSWSYYS